MKLHILVQDNRYKRLLSIVNKYIKKRFNSLEYLFYEMRMDKKLLDELEILDCNMSISYESGRPVTVIKFEQDNKNTLSHIFAEIK